MSDTTNMADIIDVRDIIERVEELESEIEEYDEKMADFEAKADNADTQAEFETLTALLDDLKGYGGDEQWRGDWYPLTLIRDSYFQDYAQELAEEIDAMPKNAQWPCTCIDWEQAARELRMDYSSIEYDGVTYWYR